MQLSPGRDQWMGQGLGPGYVPATGGVPGLRRYYKYAPSTSSFPPPPPPRTTTLYRPQMPPPSRRRVSYADSVSYSPRRYPIHARVAFKLVQLVVGVIVIGCICGAGVRFEGTALHNWAWAVRAEGQIGLVVLASLMCLGTLAILLTVAPIGDSEPTWRSLDSFLSAAGALIYLIVGGVEAWYAACYPPNGLAIRVACRLPEWAAASVFAFINMFLYSADLVFAIRADEGLLCF